MINVKQNKNFCTGKVAVPSKTLTVLLSFQTKYKVYWTCICHLEYCQYLKSLSLVFWLNTRLIMKTALCAREKTVPSAVRVLGHSSSLLFHCCDKHHEQSNLGSKGFIWLKHLGSQSIAEASQSRIQGGADRNHGNSGLFTGSWFSYLTYPKPTCPEMVSPTVGWALP